MKDPMTAVDPMEVQVADMQRHLQAVGQIVKLDLWRDPAKQYRHALKKRLTELREVTDAALALVEKS